LLYHLPLPYETQIVTVSQVTVMLTDPILTGAGDVSALTADGSSIFVHSVTGLKDFSEAVFKHIFLRLWASGF
jgi:hypothetical protein